MGAKDLIQSGIQGFVLNDHPSSESIAERLAFLLKKENRLAIGREARKTALYHRWEKKGRAVAEIYRSLSADKKRSAQ